MLISLHQNKIETAMCIYTFVCFNTRAHQGPAHNGPGGPQVLGPQGPRGPQGPDPQVPRGGYMGVAHDRLGWARERQGGCRKFPYMDVHIYRSTRQTDI